MEKERWGLGKIIIVSSVFIILGLLSWSFISYTNFPRTITTTITGNTFNLNMTILNYPQSKVINSTINMTREEKINLCENNCLYLFDRYTRDDLYDAVAVGNWARKDCYKICATEIIS